MFDLDRVQLKVILLYLVHCQPGVSWQELMNLALSSLFMDYFDFAQLANELVEDGFILLETKSTEDRMDTSTKEHQRHCYLSTEGSEILETTLPKLNEVVLDVLNQLMSNLPDETTQSRVDAQVRLALDLTSEVSLTLKEGGKNLVSIHLGQLPNQDMAYRCRNTWLTHYETLYPKILALLTSSDDLS